MILYSLALFFNTVNSYADHGLGSMFSVPVNPLSSCGFRRGHEIDSFLGAIWSLHTCGKLYTEWVLSFYDQHDHAI